MLKGVVRLENVCFGSKSEQGIKNGWVRLKWCFFGVFCYDFGEIGHGAGLRSVLIV